MHHGPGPCPARRAIAPREQVDPRTAIQKAFRHFRCPARYQKEVTHSIIKVSSIVRYRKQHQGHPRTLPVQRDKPQHDSPSMWLVSDPSCASPNPSDTNSKPRPLPSPVSGEDRLAPRLFVTFYRPPGLAPYASTPLLMVIVGHDGCNKDVHSL